ncbi:MAG: PilZ domain-containing protein [Myxococcota bacterium]
MVDQAPKERRTEPRTKKTLFCQLDCQGKLYPAVVLDISPSGLFVRTATALPIGTAVDVTLRFAGGKAWRLAAEIAREPRADARLNAVSNRGLGLHIISAPDGFAEFVESLGT